MASSRAERRRQQKKSARRQATSQPRPGFRLQMPQWAYWVGLGLLVLFTALFCARKVNFVTADLGRHIKNGEVFLQEGGPIHTNYYSYTQPEHYTVNHHWGSGVLFYGLHQWGGFTLISLVYVLCCALAVGGMLYYSWLRGDGALALLAGLMVVPLLADRSEVRPEGFSYLLMVGYWLLLDRFRQGGLGWYRLLAALAVLQVLWVNLHIFFILGPALVGLFWVDRQFVNKNGEQARQLLITLGALGLLCLANPYGIYGAIQPFTILQEYGYTIAENQPIWFMQERYWSNYAEGGGSGALTKLINYLHFELLFLAGLALAGVLAWRRRLRLRFPELMLFLAFSGLMLFAVRSISLFALAFVPWLTMGLGELWRFRLPGGLRTTALVLCGLGLFCGLAFPNWYYSPIHYTTFRNRTTHASHRLYLTGLGLLADKAVGKNVNAAARFFKQNNINGPILNNYDIGSYLIYHLFPAYRVFVDNRPEAYTVEFFDTVYEKMQKNEQTWTAIDKEYRFNAIFFYRHDMTPWAQPFLIRRVNDPQWAPVYVDDWTIILVRRAAENRGVIRRYEDRVAPLLAGNKPPGAAGDPKQNARPSQPQQQPAQR